MPFELSVKEYASNLLQKNSPAIFHKTSVIKHFIVSDKVSIFPSKNK